ncbi:hypothetical protein HY251_13560 [bacterium]|nr:hypothetical protein [bacterium]
MVPELDPTEGADAGSREEAFRRSMSEAPSCPIPGPCGRCASTGPHLCILGDILQWGQPTEIAVGVALEFFADLPPREAEEELLSRLCRRHRREAAIVLSGRALRTWALPAGPVTPALPHCAGTPRPDVIADTPDPEEAEPRSR